MMQNIKADTMKSILKRTMSKGHNYSPKASKHNHKTTSSKITKRAQKPKIKRIKHHKIQYANIRTNQKVVDELKAYQIATGFSSRSALLEAMVKICKPELLRKQGIKSKYYKELKLIRLQRDLKDNK